MVYHSKRVPEKDTHRFANAQKITWSGDIPTLGAPIDPGAPIEDPSEAKQEKLL
jgi:hypothetical protein